jgi:hypothetical protein
MSGQEDWCDFQKKIVKEVKCALASSMGYMEIWRAALDFWERSQENFQKGRSVLEGVGGVFVACVLPQTKIKHVLQIRTMQRWTH